MSKTDAGSTGGMEREDDGAADADADAAADAFAEKASDRFDVVCFDLDQCAVGCHSRGRLMRKDVDGFASKVSSDFVRAVPALLERGVKLAIVTHSDLAQHGPTNPRRGGEDASSFLLGDELVHEVLLRAVPEHAHRFFVVAWRPKSRGEEGSKDPGKLRHLRTCAAFYDVPLRRCVLFDDDATNCALTGGGDRNGGDRFSAYRCDPDVGFRFTDLKDEKSRSDDDDDDDYFVENSDDGTVDRLGRWDAKWNREYKGEPGFHLPTANPNLAKHHGGAFDPPKGEPILLPLCGKTIDLRWLASAGHRCVVGVEGVQRGIDELRDELLRDLRKTGDASGRVWTTAPEGRNWFHSDSSSAAKSIEKPEEEEDACVSIVRADFFDVSPLTFGVRSPCFGAVYDRGAIVAIPPHSRHQYVDVIDSLLIPGGQILMVTVDSGRDSGPPFSVTPGVVDELFSTRDYSTQLLDVHDGPWGKDSKEYVFVLRKAS